MDRWDITFDSFTPSSDDVLFLIDNTGVGDTTGMFQYADDSRIGTFGGFHWFITYDADNGTLPGLDGGQRRGHSIAPPCPSRARWLCWPSVFSACWLSPGESAEETSHSS